MKKNFKQEDAAVKNAINMFIVAMPFPYGGGGKRALLAIKEYKKHGINPFLILPWTFHLDALKEMRTNVQFLLKEGINIYGSVIPPRFFSITNFTFKHGLAKLLASKGLLKTTLQLKAKTLPEPHCVMSMHESLDSIATALEIGKIFSLKRAALLQLPPFYGDICRNKRIEEAYGLWLDVAYSNPILREALWILQREAFYSTQKTLKVLLNNFDLLIAVSKSIPIEMGEKWTNKVIPLDPGVALPQEDINLINELRRKSVKKDKVIVFGGRPRPDKGIVEALLAWKFIVKNVGQDYKLIVTGSIRPTFMKKLKVFCRKLNIANSVMFTGFISKKERFSLIARAMMMLYPSHVDAFPYAVLEALNLNTPVVAYSIPALKIYYEGLNGVILVKESDIEALVQKSVETMKNKKICTEKQKSTRSWDEIISEETKLIKKLCQPTGPVAYKMI